MTTCKYLSALFGRDTRGTQWANLLVSTGWFLAMALDWFSVMSVALPPRLVDFSLSVMGFLAGSVAFTVIGFVTDGPTHQRTKAFGLSLGALCQVIIANGYASLYPPVDMMIAVSTILGVWFILAVWYISKCEGKNGHHCREA